MAARRYACAICGRKLRIDRCIYSTHTRARYCWPGEGCWKRKGSTLSRLTSDGPRKGRPKRTPTDGT